MKLTPKLIDVEVYECADFSKKYLLEDHDKDKDKVKDKC